MKSTAHAVSLVLACLISTSVYSEDESKPRNILSLDELRKIKVIGSTLTPLALETVPSAVSVFTHEDISKMGIETLDELMNLAPGFQSYRSNSSLNNPHSSRGRSIGANGAEVLILVDGQRLNDPRVSGSVLTVPKFPVKYIKQIEFIRGPGASIYGSNAMMGVINIVTRSDVNEASVSIGSFNRRQAYFMTSSQLDALTLEIFAHIESDEGDNYFTQTGFAPTANTGTDDPRSLADLNIKLAWKRLQVQLQHYQSEIENFYEANHIANGFNQRKAKFSALSINQELNWRSLASTLRLSYTRTDVRSYGQLSPQGSLGRISSPMSLEPLFASPGFKGHSEMRALWHNHLTTNSQTSFQFGLEARHIKAPEVIAMSNFDIGDLVNKNFPVPYYGRLIDNTAIQLPSSRDIVGVYAQYQADLFKNTHLTAGIRYDNFSNIGSQSTPRLGLVQEISPNSSLKFLYGEAFRAPAESELYLINNPVFLGNPDLEPETVRSWEVLWTGQWPSLSVSLGYFENRFKDAIVLASVDGEPLQYKNVDQNPAKGIEFELAHQFSEHWNLRASYTYFRELPDLSFRETDQKTSLIINYQRSRWNANLVANYHDERQTPAVDANNQRMTLDGYWQLFAKLNYQSSADWNCFVIVKNLLDKDYRTPASSTNLSEGIPNRGREIGVGVAWQFK